MGIYSKRKASKGNILHAWPTGRHLRRIFSNRKASNGNILHVWPIERHLRGIYSMPGQ
jgi:hypothetical protein